jgi:catalase
VGRLVLDRMPDDFFAESEQLAFGAGVLVDGLDFAEDAMLLGRTFAYPDTQRYRIGQNYPQLPVNQARHAVRSDPDPARPAYAHDLTARHPHVDYQPAITGALLETPEPVPTEPEPVLDRPARGERPARANDYAQAGQRYLLMEQWERDDLVRNLVDLLAQCAPAIQQRMVWHFLMAENELGLRIGEGLDISPDDIRSLKPLPGQTLTDEDRERLPHLGKNPQRDVVGRKMTHCVPNERAKVTR